MARRSPAEAGSPRADEWSCESRLAEYRELLGEDVKEAVVADPSSSRTRRPGRGFGPAGWLVVGIALGGLLIGLLVGALTGSRDGRLGAYAAGEAGVPFESAEDGFAAEFPVEPVRDVRPPVPEDPAAGEIVGYEARLDGGLIGGPGQVVSVHQGTVPGAVSVPDPERVLWQAVKGGSIAVEGTIEWSAYSLVDGHPAMDFTLTNGEVSSRGRFLLVRNRLFVLQVVAGEPRPDAFSRLAETFRLL